VYGLAREAAAAFDVPIRPIPGTSGVGSPSSDPAVPVAIEDRACGRYALGLASVQVGPSPSWLATRLLAAGVRPINNVVDVTNYVMLELGQPLHAFDLEKLSGPSIRIRRAAPGETLRTLDGQSRTLQTSMLVIADASVPVAIAGVMGGSATEVSAATTRIALESAWFQPESVRATSRVLGLKTEASIRFERGADPEAPVAALERALTLLEEIGAGTRIASTLDVYPHPTAPRALRLRRARLFQVLGTEVPDAAVERILQHLAFGVVTRAGEGWDVHVPSFRVDVTREVDLIEDVGRHWGLDRIPATFPALAGPPRPSDRPVMLGRRVRRLLCGAGLQEAVTFTFLAGPAAAPFTQAADRVVIKNPLSEKFEWLRPALTPGLLDALTYNRNRQVADVRLFEVGTVFSATRGERTHVGWVFGGRRDDHWTIDDDPMAFTDAMGIAELLASATGLTLTADTQEVLPWLAGGQQARLLDASGDSVGWVGRVAVPGVDDDVFAGELALEALAAHATDVPRAIAPLPRHPSVVRDLSIIVDERLPAAEVRGTIRAHAPATLVSVREFDRYQGKGVPDGRVSLSLRLTFRAPDRTLTDAEVQTACDAIVQALARTHGATLRGA
jgi:phenylalanyl-tRNA synthetase beta chain